MSLTNREIARLNANNPRTQTRVSMNGNKVAFVSMPKDLQSSIKERLAEKDPVMAEGLKGNLPGIKIDGKQVSRDNIKDFEIKSGKKIESTEAKKEPEIKKKVYSEDELYAMNKAEQIKILKAFDAKTIPSTEKERVKLILKLQ